MPVLKSRGISVRLLHSDLVASTLTSAEAQSSSSARRGVERSAREDRAITALLNGNVLCEQPISVGPESCVGGSLSFLGNLNRPDVPFFMVAASVEPRTAPSSDASSGTASTRSWSETPLDSTKQAVRLRPKDAQTIPQGRITERSLSPSTHALLLSSNLARSHTSAGAYAPLVSVRALAVAISLSVNNVLPAGQRGIKVVTYLNGTLASSSTYNARNVNGKQRSSTSNANTEDPENFSVIVSGCRTHHMVERPWVILPAGLEADGSLMGSRHRAKGKISTPEERWDQIALALLAGADQYGVNDHGDHPPAAEYLQSLASLPMPAEFAQFQRYGGHRFAVIDVLLISGKPKQGIGNRKPWLVEPGLSPDPNYNCSPENSSLWSGDEVAVQMVRLESWRKKWLQLGINARGESTNDADDVSLLPLPIPQAASRSQPEEAEAQGTGELRSHPEDTDLPSTPGQQNTQVTGKSEAVDSQGRLLPSTPGRLSPQVVIPPSTPRPRSTHARPKGELDDESRSASDFIPIKRRRLNPPSTGDRITRRSITDPQTAVEHDSPKAPATPTRTTPAEIISSVVQATGERSGMFDFTPMSKRSSGFQSPGSGQKRQYSDVITPSLPVRRLFATSDSEDHPRLTLSPRGTFRRHPPPPFDDPGTPDDAGDDSGSEEAIPEIRTIVFKYAEKLIKKYRLAVPINAFLEEYLPHRTVPDAPRGPKKKAPPKSKKRKAPGKKTTAWTTKKTTSAKKKSTWATKQVPDSAEMTASNPVKQSAGKPAAERVHPERRVIVLRSKAAALRKTDPPAIPPQIDMPRNSLPSSLKAARSQMASSRRKPPGKVKFEVRRNPLSQFEPAENDHDSHEDSLDSSAPSKRSHDPPSMASVRGYSYQPSVPHLTANEQFQVPELCRASVVTYAENGAWGNADVEVSPNKAAQGARTRRSLKGDDEALKETSQHLPIRQIADDRCTEFYEDHVVLGVRFVVPGY